MSFCSRGRFDRDLFVRRHGQQRIRAGRIGEVPFLRKSRRAAAPRNVTVCAVLQQDRRAGRVHDLGVHAEHGVEQG